MGFINEIKERVLGNSKTTSGGVGIGVIMSGVGAYVLNEAGCDFSNVSIAGVLGMLLAGPAVVGGAATDNGKSVESKEKPNATA